MFALRTIKARLFVLLAALGSLLLGSSLIGEVALSWSNASLKTVYEDRVVPLGQFMAMRDFYDKLLDASRAVREKTLEPAEGAKRIETNLSGLNQQWTAYLATFLTPEEKVLVTEMQTRLDQNATTIAAALRGLRERDVKDYSATHLLLNQMMEPTVAVLAKLTALQLRETKAEFERAQDIATWSTSVLAACLIAAGCGIIYGLFTILAGITRPLDRTTAMMGQLATGDLTVAVTGTERHDEIGAVARAVQVFKDAMIAKRDADKATVAENATKLRRAQLLDGLTKQFEAKIFHLTQALSSAATEMEATAQIMSRTASGTIQQAVSVASAAEETSANVQTVAAASEEMAASIQEIAGQVAHSSSIADRAAADAEQTNLIVQGLAAGADKIGEVVGLISGIAAQTNLLALNATIEAARAGEAGRGFAVVASEVKELAGQTARATETISVQITAIQGETRQAVSAIQGIGATISEMRSIAFSVAAAMEEQGAATQEIVRNVAQAAQGTQSVTISIVEVKDVAGETGTASAQVLASATELSRQSEHLSEEVASFLATVRAA